VDIGLRAPRGSQVNTRLWGDARPQWPRSLRAGGGSEAFLTLRVKQAKIDGLGAAIARGGGVVCEQLTRNQCLHARGFDIVDMHENIGPAAIGHDKAISAIFVKEFDAPTRH
jgi:hypothetical protein